MQYEPSPGTRINGSQGVPNPTLSTVVDPRRLALSEEIGATARDMRAAIALLEPHIRTLRQALARWEGEEGSHDL
ncbi:hypothetical protein JNUCC0626_18365 [Lentzea sp. JNUCC 0626]